MRTGKESMTATRHCLPRSHDPQAICMMPCFPQEAAVKTQSPAPVPVREGFEKSSGKLPIRGISPGGGGEHTFGVDMPRHIDTAARGSDLRTYFHLFSSPRFEIRYDARKLIRGLLYITDMTSCFGFAVTFLCVTDCIRAAAPCGVGQSITQSHASRCQNKARCRTENFMGLVPTPYGPAKLLLGQANHVGAIPLFLSTIENAPVELLVGRWVMVIMGP